MREVYEVNTPCLPYEGGVRSQYILPSPLRGDSNVALHVIERHSNIEGFDMHAYTKDIKANSEVFDQAKVSIQEQLDKFVPKLRLLQ